MSKHHTLGEMNPMPMAAKTQDAAGVLVRNNERVHYQPDANPGDRWMVTRDGEPRLWAESLYVIAQRLNLDIEEFNRCAALMRPAAPTGEAYVPWDGHDYARDRESLEDCVHDAAAKVRAGDHVDIWLPTLVAHAITFLEDATLLHASRAARVPAPSAPQEPRGEPGEGKVKVVVVPPREPKVIQSPAKCTQCGQRVDSSTLGAGVDLDICPICGGQMVTEARDAD